MKFSYMQTPLYRYTFQNKKIKKWVEDNSEGLVLNLFAGKTLLACNEIRNDLDEIDAIADYHMDALKFCETWKGHKFHTVLLDPPYSYRKSMEMYKGKITSPFNALKDSICAILAPNGIVITFGYHAIVMGKNRGFKQEHILLICPGGAIHTVIAVIERKEAII